MANLFEEMGGIYPTFSPAPYHCIFAGLLIRAVQPLSGFLVR